MMQRGHRTVARLILLQSRRIKYLHVAHDAVYQIDVVAVDRSNNESAADGHNGQGGVERNFVMVKKASVVRSLVRVKSVAVFTYNLDVSTYVLNISTYLYVGIVGSYFLKGREHKKDLF